MAEKYPLRFQVQLSEEDADKVLRLADIEDMSASAILRRLVKRALAEIKTPQPNGKQHEQEFPSYGL
jgi:hypothetical protein